MLYHCPSEISFSGESNHVKSNRRSIILSFKNLTEVDRKVYWSYCQREGIQFTRSRPYKKDDNAHRNQRGLPAMSIVYVHNQRSKMAIKFYFSEWLI